MEPRRLLAVVGVIVAAVLAVIAVLLLRSPEEIPVAGSEPTPTPPSTPTPIRHEPVEGEVQLDTVVTYHGPIFFGSGDGRHDAPATDGDAVDAFVADIADWLDRHLTDLQDGRGGHLDEVAVGGLLEGAVEAAVAGVSTDLTSFIEPVTAARYGIVVAAEGAPQWAQVRVDVTVRRMDPEAGQVADDPEDAEETRSAELTFVAEDDGPALIAAAPVDPGSRSMRVPPPPEDGRYG